MVEVLVGDLFNSPAQTLVNTVNCVGIMGKGIALEFKKRFPDMYADYVQRCKQHQVKLGQPYVYPSLLLPWILNFPTKDHWRSVSKLSDIVNGLVYLEDHYREWGITSLAVPPLGCGNGQLDWSIVGPTLYRHLNRLDIPVELYAPLETPLDQLSPEFLGDGEENFTWQQLPTPYKIEPAWIALVEMLARIEEEPYHWPIGRTSFQKLAYFATESGLPTGLTFKKGSYGPFSLQLKSQITRLVNHGLINEQRKDQMFVVFVGPTYWEDRHNFDPYILQWEIVINKVVDLFVRMRTQQAEIAATVHFAAHHLLKMGETSEDDVLRAVRAWKVQRKPALNDEDVASTIRNLNMLGWIDAQYSPELISESFVEV